MKLKLAWIEVRTREYETGELVNIELMEETTIRFEPPSHDDRECYDQIAYFEIEES